MKNLVIFVLTIALIAVGANAVLMPSPSPVPAATSTQLPTPAAAPAVTSSAVPASSSAVATSNVVTAPVASDDSNRPCDFSTGISMPVPGSANETVGDIQKKQEADSKTPRPRLKCLKEMSGEKLRILLNNSHMGMQNGRAGIFVSK